VIAHNPGTVTSLHCATGHLRVTQGMVLCALAPLNPRDEPTRPRCRLPPNLSRLAAARCGNHSRVQDRSSANATVPIQRTRLTKRELSTMLPYRSQDRLRVDLCQAGAVGSGTAGNDSVGPIRNAGLGNLQIKSRDKTPDL